MKRNPATGIEFRTPELGEIPCEEGNNFVRKKRAIEFKEGLEGARVALFDDSDDGIVRRVHWD
jgi:hypothetical protein